MKYLILFLPLLFFSCTTINDDSTFKEGECIKLSKIYESKEEKTIFLVEKVNIKNYVLSRHILNFKTNIGKVDEVILPIKDSAGYLKTSCKELMLENNY